jgi:hypothetical protein
MERRRKMAFKKAERTQLYLRCALFGPSGSGKTMTGLRIAKGIAEKMRVPYAVIDTEARSASKYADRFQFEVEDLEKKTVDNYIASMNDAAKAGYKVLVIDSLSHGWRELTEEVDRITQASTSKNSVLSWAKVNPKQKRFIDAILNYPGHIIVTMRSKTEWVIGQGKDGKIAPEKLGLAPEQGKGIEYEFDLLIELTQKHQATVTKDRTGKFQDETIDLPGEDFGVALYDWLTSGKEIKQEPVDPSGVITVSSIVQSEEKLVKKDSTSEKSDLTLKDKSSMLIQEIGVIVTANDNGKEYFTEAEKDEARKIIKGIKLSEKGVDDLNTLKELLSDQLNQRCKKAA